MKKNEHTREQEYQYGYELIMNNCVIDPVPVVVVVVE
jgi:hypothetical protein